MNRKGVREQNDISIIRNLPKRLQKRIVEDIGDDSLITHINVDSQIARSRSSTSSGGVVMVARKHDNEMLLGKLLHKPETSGGVFQEVNGGEDDKRIDFFLRKAPSTVNNLSKNNHKRETVPVLETSGQTIDNKTSSTKCDRSGSRSCSNAAIPGILRLNDVKQVQSVGRDKNKFIGEKNVGRENGKKGTAHIHQLTEQSVNAEKVVTKSPSRQLQRHPRPPAWFEILADAQYAELLPKAYEKVTTMIQQNTVIEKWSEFTEARAELQKIFAKLLLQQLKLCCEQKIDSFFWKLLYYNVREYLVSNNKSNADDNHHRWLSLVEEGLYFYTNLNMQLNAKYINIDQQNANNIAQENVSSQRTVHKFEFIAKVAAQKLLICLGDLCRYKAKEVQSNDYKDATKYYQQAQALIPTNGIPYNQLAIVAIHERKKFDAIYFHMRSLMSSNAIYSARESLLVLFDEIRKKYEETELKTSPIHQGSPRHNHVRTSKSIRKEVWIQVDGVRRLHRASEPDDCGSKYAVIAEEKRLNELTSEELLRRFTSLYLYVLGKLYTGIGMEMIIEHQRKLLVQLSVLLKHSTFPIKRSRLLRIVALNIFMLEHNMHKESRREIRYYAFHFCNQIFGLLLRKCNEFFETYNVDVLDPEKTCHAELSTLLQYINIYTDWLARNVDIWESVRNEEHAIIDSWSEWECIFPRLRRLCDASPANISQYKQLEEELYLLGFTPLMSATSINTNKQTHTERATEKDQFLTRIVKICAFQDCYEKHQASLHVHDDVFTLEELNGAMEKALCTLLSDGDDNSENMLSNGTNSVLTGKETNSVKSAAIEDAQISLLSQRKKELEARTNVKKMYNAKLEEILKFVDTKLYIEVRPKYLMPDTNCFIDCLDDFEKLIQEYKRYVLVIPLTVVKELDGLSKGVKVESYQNSLQMNRIHHYDDVSTCAKRSLDFIRSAKNNVKCATTKGSFISSSLFALAEEENVSNDDKILATAVALSKTMSAETNKDGKCFIQTELVLVTTDRNLRVKALARNLTVSKMGEFLQWVKDCNT